MMRASLVAVVLLGCGSDGGGATIDGNGGDDDAPPDATIPPGFTELIGRDWQIDTHTSDNYFCRKIQVTQEMWISAFSSLSPLGTHHQIITVSDDPTNLGDYSCNSTNLDPKMLYAGGIDTDALQLPDNVAVHVQAGQYLNLNLHLFDATDNPLSGHSAVLVKTIDASQVVNEADMTFAGKRIFTVPKQTTNYTITGGCVVPAGVDWNVFAVWPHMHQLAVHQTDEIYVGANPQPTTILDVPYTFTEQQNYNMNGIVFHPGDTVNIECIYDNPTMMDVNSGEGANNEMCLLGLYRYPVIAQANPYGCTD